MAFLRIDKIFHGGRRGLIEYFAFRIFLVSLVMLIVPLLLHNVVMYQREYNDRKEDLYMTINVIAQNRENAIQRILHSHMLALDLLSTHVNFSGPTTEDEQTKLNHYLGDVTKKSVASVLFYLKQTSKGDLICTASSMPSMIGNSYPVFEEASSHDEFSMFSSEILHCERCLFLSKTMPPSADKSLEMIVTAIPGDHFIQKLVDDESTPYPLTLSVIGKDNRVKLSTFKPLIGKELAFLKEEKRIKPKDKIALYPGSDVKDSYYLVSKERKGFAILVPVKDSEVSLLIDVLESHLEKLQQGEYIFRFISFIFLLILFGGGGAILLVRRLAKPYNHLYDVMDKVSAGERTARYQQDPLAFEINILGTFFNKVIDSVIEKSQEAERQRLAKHILEQELQIGRKIQMSMLPSTVPEFPGLDIASAYVPAKEVGGDFYDLFLNQNEGKQQLAIVMADTSGKGISACLYSLSVRSLLRSIGSSSDSVSNVLCHANNLFYQDSSDSGMFVTTWFAFYDKLSKELRYSSCGHYPGLLLKSDGNFEELNTPGIALGVKKLDHTETSSVTLAKGDLLVLYTDGVVEANNKDGEFYGNERLREFVKRQTKDSSAQEIIARLRADIKEFSDGAAPFDDLTALVVRVL